MFLWEDNFVKLRKFTKTNNRFPIEKDGEIYNWFMEQKKMHSDGILEEDKLSKMDTLLPYQELKWDGLKFIPIISENDKTFISMFRKLLRYKELPSPCDQDANALVIWIRDQYYLYNRNRIRQDRLDYLESLPYWNWEDVKYKKRKTVTEYEDTDDESDHEPEPNSKKPKIEDIIIRDN